jgi:drug/metabolite transporter (DMT)-like permease
MTNHKLSYKNNVHSKINEKTQLIINNNNDKLYGAFNVFLSGFFLSLMGVFVKLNNNTLKSIEMAFLRCLISTIIINFILIFYYNINILGPQNKRTLLFFRGLIGTISMIAFYIGIDGADIGDATALYFMSPAFTVCLTYLILNEKINSCQLFGLILSISGVIIISRPQFIFDKSENPKYDQYFYICVACCLLAALCDSFVYIFIRKIGKTVNNAVVLNYLILFGSIFTIILGCLCEHYKIKHKTFRNLRLSFNSIYNLKFINWLYCFGLAIAGILGQIFLVSGLKHLEAAPASVIKSIDVFFAYIWQTTIFHKKLQPLSIIGSVFVVCGTISIAICSYTKNISIDENTPFNTPFNSPKTKKNIINKYNILENMPIE